jgi:hypothetical protein
MRSRRRTREAEVDPFYDMLFNMLIAFVFCFIVALLAMNPKALKAGDIPAKAEYIITVSWPDLNPNDIDTWVQDPGGNLVWFRARGRADAPGPRRPRPGQRQHRGQRQAGGEPAEPGGGDAARHRPGRVHRQRPLLREQGRQAGRHHVSASSR